MQEFTTNTDTSIQLYYYYYLLLLFLLLFLLLLLLLLLLLVLFEAWTLQQVEFCYLSSVHQAYSSSRKEKKEDMS